MPIVDLQRRLHETGRIRIGVTVPTTKPGQTRPAKLETFRFTSQDHRALHQIADLYGGTVASWATAPVGDQHQVITNTNELRVAVPPERMGLTQSMELWSGGGLVRRCDGNRQQDDEPCVCAQLDADDQTPRCARHTRLSLMLADLATTGLWRLDTQGYYASEELAGAFELAQIIAAATGRTLLPGRLRLEQREIRRPGEPVKRFPVPVLDFEMDATQLLGPPADPTVPAVNGLTPIPAQTPTTLAAELAAVEHPEPPPARKNAAAAIPDPGLDPFTDLAQPAAEPRITRPQQRKLMALFNQRGIGDRDDRLDWANQHLNRTIVSSNELTIEEASRLIDRLEQEADAMDAFREQTE